MKFTAFTRWRRAARYGTLRDEIMEPLRGSWEQFWFCWVGGKHQAKFSTSPRCYRCGRVVP